jgi:hypothetical protein
VNIRLQSHHQQIVHQLGVLREGLGNARGFFELRGQLAVLVFGAADAGFDFADRGEVLVDFPPVGGA